MRGNIAATILAASLLAAVLPGGSVAAADVDAVPTVEQIHQAAQAGQYDKAQKMMDQVLRAHPNSGKAHYVQAELYAKEGKFGLARAELGKAEELNPGLSQVSARSVQALRAELGVRPPAAGSLPKTAAPTDAPLTTSRIPLANRGGTLVAPVIINAAIKLDFTVDSGAADVTIPADVFSTLVRAGTITRSDMRGSRRYVNATGESREWDTFVIRSLKVGDVEVLDVEASVAPAKAPLLLGQSFLKRFKNWSVDNTTQELILQR